MRREIRTLALAMAVMFAGTALVQAQDTTVEVTIENVAPRNGVALTPIWVGFHSGSFDSYNGGLTSLEGLERVAEDGNTSLISEQFLDFRRRRGGYTYIDNSGSAPASRLVRTGDLSDRFRQDATLGRQPLRPGQTTSQRFRLRADGSNDFFSYVSMVLPTNDYFVANGSPVAHDIGRILRRGRGRVSFFIGTPNGGVNDAGTESENFQFSAGNALFPGRNLPGGQVEPNTGRSTNLPIANVVGDAFDSFELITAQDRARVAFERASTRRVIRVLRAANVGGALDSEIRRVRQRLRDIIEAASINVNGLDFNDYPDGIARVTIRVVR